MRAFLRFQLTNGMVSLVGNLLLMRVLLHAARLPLLVANAVAILACSLVNFALSHGWAFRESDQSQCGLKHNVMLRVGWIPPASD